MCEKESSLQGGLTTLSSLCGGGDAVLNATSKGLKMFLLLVKLRLCLEGGFDLINSKSKRGVCVFFWWVSSSFIARINWVLLWGILSGLGDPSWGEVHADNPRIYHVSGVNSLSSLEKWGSVFFKSGGGSQSKMVQPPLFAQPVPGEVTDACQSAQKG